MKLNVKVINKLIREKGNGTLLKDIKLSTTEYEPSAGIIIGMPLYDTSNNPIEDVDYSFDITINNTKYSGILRFEEREGSAALWQTKKGDGLDEITFGMIAGCKGVNNGEFLLDMNKAFLLCNYNTDTTIISCTLNSMSKLTE